MTLPVTTTIKVRLKTDMTHLHPELTRGREGYTIGEFGQSSRLSKKFTGVWFPGIKIVDVDWAALEIVEGQRPTEEVPARRKPRGAARQLLKRLGL